jgi:peptide/nickel transport system substrate-binding protein
MFKKLVPVLIVLVLLISSCGTQAPAAPAATVAPKTATFIFTQEFDNLNPAYTNMWFSAITQQLWNCWAWSFDDKNAAFPVLVKELPSAANGGLSSDGKVITLKLREDIVWSDGTPITSDDFLFTYKMYMDKKNTVASQNPYDKMVSVETPDKQTVVITFTDPYAAWLGSLYKGLLPKHVLQPVFDSKGSINDAEWNRNPTVGCGPYVLEKWESGSYASFVSNQKYWGAKPKIDKIFIRFVPDDASQIAALKAGEGDLGTFIANSDIPALETAGIQVFKAFSGYNEGVYFNMGDKANPATKDVNVRQAIAYAIDREAIVKDLLLGKTAVAATDWDNTPYMDPSIKPYPYDPEKAKALLDAAGWMLRTGADGVREKDGVKLILKYGTTTREIRKDTQAVVQNQLAKVGIKVELLNVDSDTFFAGYDKNGPAATGQYDMFEYSTVPSGYPDPDAVEWLCNEIPTNENPSGTNWSFMCDKELNDLFLTQATQADFTQRQQTFYKITKRIFDQAYFLGYWQDPDMWAISGKLTGVKISGVTPFYNITEWDLK